MPRPYATALMPVGTVIEHDGETYKKTHESRHEPFPWTTENGCEFGDERMRDLLDDGGQVVEEPPAVLRILRAARDDDLWQEDDQSTTHEYLHREFGLSDPLRDATEEADAAARDGLIRLHVSALGARRWGLTETGRAVLASHDAKRE